MRPPGGSRERLAGILSAAFAQGLLSEQTLSHRLELLFGPRLIEPEGLVGDLTLGVPRGAHRLVAPFSSALAAVRERVRLALNGGPPGAARLVLALDWRGRDETLLLGRGVDCDISLRDRTVSRRHARLLFRDGGWVVQDLGSKNGLTVNGARVGRCALRPGDRLGLGMALVEVD